jgi:hypothetical protein
MMDEVQLWNEQGADRRNLAEGRKVNDRRLSGDVTAIAKSLRMRIIRFIPGSDNK